MSESTTPRDVKILHLILASMGVTSYQDHVPLQLMDFAHRYTVNVLSDAIAYNDYANSSGAHQPAGNSASSAPITVDDVRLAVSMRVQSQFKPAAPKEVLLELAQERNRRPLPQVPQGYGLRLPPEKYCLTGVNRDIDTDDDIMIRGAVAAKSATNGDSVHSDETRKEKSGANEDENMEDAQDAASDDGQGVESSNQNEGASAMDTT